MTDLRPTPYLQIDAPVVRRNIANMAAFARSAGLGLRPHTKTHKSPVVGKMQMDAGAIGLTVAKPGEAEVMASVTGDLLLAYPAVHPARCAALAELARSRTIRVGLDSAYAADQIATTAQAAGVTIGVLVDLDTGFGRTGVQGPAEALALAEHVSRLRGLRLDGLMFFPGHVSGTPEAQLPMLRKIDDLLGQTIDLWREKGLEAPIISGGSTPSAAQSRAITRLTEFRPGTYVYNDMNCVRGGSATPDDCAARVIVTVVSTAVPGQIVIDAGTKTLTSDRCGPAPDTGHGYIVELPDAKIAKLSEEHGQVDVRQCSRVPKVGDRLTVIPNHICPCVNLQDVVWWREDAEEKALHVEARGKLF